ncbi:MAG: protein kinase [Acidobacteria bacterium]|nr:protein kinase [Acidobacteriota bacterium]
MLERIGRYEVKAELGRGGFGRVYRAWDPTVGRMVAIKTLNAGGDPEMLQRFRNEAAAAGKLRHRNIIIIHDFGEQDGEPYIVMELLDGEDLQRVMQNQRPLTLLERMQIMEQVAEGLDHAHRNGVVHRDVKPANMMVLPDRSVKIMDFGIALVTQVAGSRLTKTGTIPGTLKYMAPEQFRGATNDPLSDIFAYGVTYYELLSGVHPFDGPTQPAIMYNILSGEPRPLSELMQGCPDGLSEVIMRCLHKDREGRYSTLDDLQFDLKPILAELKHDHARGLYTEAERLAGAQQFDTALALVRESLELNPADRGARRLRERIQQEMQRAAAQPKLEALLNTGRHLLASRKFEDAINTFESALRLDKASQEVASLLQQAQAIRQQSAEAERLLRDAKTALGNQDLTGAYQRINEALQRDPSHPDAVRLGARVKEEITSRERDRRRREEISQARGALLLGSFEEALAMLERIEQAYPESPEVPQLVAEARAAKEAHLRQQQLQSALAESKNLLREKQLPTAVHRLESLVKDFPSSVEANELLDYARNELKAKKRQETIERLVREVQALAANHQFDAAIQMLEKGLGYFPGDITIDRQLDEMRAARAAYQRQVALDEALSQARQWRRDSQHESAIRVLDAFRATFGNDAQVDSLRREIEQEWEDRKRRESIQTLLAEIERLAEKNDPATALKVADQAVSKYGAVPELEVARARVEKLLQQKKRTEAVSKLVTEVTELTSTHRFDRALELIERGMVTYPGDSALHKAREAAAEARAAHERREAIAAAMAQARAMLERRQGERAASICDELLRRYPDAEEVVALRTQAREQVRIALEQQRAIAAACEQARALAAAGKFDEAIAGLEQASKDFAGQAPISAVLKEIRDRKTTTDREHGIAAALDACDQFRVTQEWDKARALLDEAAKKFGDDVRLRERRQRVQLESDAAKKAAEEARKQAEAERQRQLEEQQRQLEEQQRLEAKRKAEHDARLREEAERKRLAEREQGIAAAIETCDQHRATQDWARARAVLDEATKSLGDDDRLRERRQRVQLESDAAKKAAEEARKQAEAEQQRLEAKRKAEHEARLREEAERKRLAEREQGIAAAIETCDQHRATQDWARARAVLDQATKSLGDDDRLRERRQRVQLESDAAQKAAEEARKRDEAERRKNEEAELRRAAEAKKAAEEARKREEAERLRLEAERRKQAADRALAIGKLAQKAEKELSQNQPDAALTTVEQALTAYPGEAVFLTLRDRAKSAAAKKRQDEERKQQEAERKRQAEEDARKRKAAEAAAEAAARKKPAAVEPPKPPPVLEPTAPPPASRKWMPIAAAAVLLAGGGGIYIATRPTDTATPPKVEAPPPKKEPESQPKQETAKKTEPTPKKDTPPVTPSQGTLVVATGISGADVFLDGRKAGATDSSGEFKAPLEAKRYAVRVEKPGYQPAAPQNVTVPKGGQQQVRFALTAMEATLTLRGGTAGAQVKIDGRPSGTLGQDGSFTGRLTPGEHSIEITKDQFQARTIRRTFDPGQSVTLDRNDINLTAIPKADPQAAIAQEWDKLKSSRDIGQLEDFTRKHKGNPLARNAEDRITELRWESLDKNNLKALQEFRQRHPQGEFANRATREIERLEKAASDRKQADDRKAAEERKLAEDRAKAEGAKIAALKADRDGVLQALNKFTTAIGKKDSAGMSSVFPGSERQWKDTFANKNFVVTMTLTPVGDPEINGDNASITCDRQTKTVDRGREVGGAGTQRIRVTLAKRAGTWVIQSMK